MGCYHSTLLFLMLFLSWGFFMSSTHQLQATQTQLLIQLRKHLEYPIQLSNWENYNGDFCNLDSNPQVSIKCEANSITELKINGDKLSKVSDFHGYAVQNQTLSESFSIDSLVVTLARLTTLRVLSLVSLGIWGPLPDKIHRLYSLELLDMSSNFMFGSIPNQISRLVKLRTLSLDGNFFNESVPDWFDSLSNLTILSLKNNRLKGQFPSSICKITTLTDLSLSHNNLTGKLPDLSTLSSLHLLDLRENQFDSELSFLPKEVTTVLLSNNSFKGKIPEEFGKLNQLQHLDLSSNSFVGTPPFAIFSLPNISYLNLALNMLSGSLLNIIKCGNNLGFVDISSNMLTGRLPSCLDTNSSNKRVVKFSGNCLSVDNKHEQLQQRPESSCQEAIVKNKRSLGKSIWVIIGVISLMIVFLIVFAIMRVIFRKKYHPRETVTLQHTVPKVIQDSLPSGISSEVLANARIIAEVSKLGTQVATSCRVFSIEDLAAATDNFSASMFLGEGSIGKLYKGRLENGSYIAIRSLSLFKKYSIRNLKVRLDLLSKLRHPHLVGFLGYCIDEDGLEYSTSSRVFLVYEFISNGNFRAHLSDNSPGVVLKWSDRLAVLIGVAKAVHFLHTGIIPASSSNRLRTNNILLDEHRIAKLSDYGMAIITEELDQLEAKGDGPKSWHMKKLADDVYDFGFILLESLTDSITAMNSLVQLPYDATVKLMLTSLERNLLPDAVIRRLTRLLLAGRLRSCFKSAPEQQLEELLAFVHSLKEMPIAVKTDDPKSQHYELPTSFFKLVLGKHFKYSCCYFRDKLSTLEDAEEAMLELYCEKSQLQDGHTVLDVGCGWGSLIIYIAQKYRNCKVTGICNSVTQKAHIEEQCGKLNLMNLEVIVADISTFEMEGSYDRIFSIEMFEHMKNYRDLLKKISNWMNADGFLFVHHFCHKSYAYHFEDVNEDDWITRYFFSGGTMPSANLLLYFQDDVSVVDHWLVNGKHYAQTSEEWLKRMDQNIMLVKPIMESTYGKEQAVKWTVYWRTFFISVAELFAYNNGEEWMVTHYLFKKK